jgi:hypothetical protein
MSETRLLEVVLYWYNPLVFGIYGLMALRIKKHIGDEDNNAIKHLFSGNDPIMLPLTIILILLSGIIGAVLFFVPLSIFKVKDDMFDVYVSSTATVFFILLLYLFFELLWPSL